MLDKKKILLQGVNGLRDRIAGRLRIPDMALVNWNDRLAEMAFNHMRSCNFYRNDECTELFENVPINRTDASFLKQPDIYKYIAQNRFCKKSELFQSVFIEEALRKWYFEKVKLNPPEDMPKNDRHNYKYIVGHNNFTVLASPTIYLMGCSISRFRHTFCLFCNFFPYFQNIGNFEFKTGEKPECPDLFPFLSKYLDHICIDKPLDWLFGSAQQLGSFSILLLMLIQALILCFYYIE